MGRAVAVDIVLVEAADTVATVAVVGTYLGMVESGLAVDTGPVQGVAAVGVVVATAWAWAWEGEQRHPRP